MVQYSPPAEPAQSKLGLQGNNANLNVEETSIVKQILGRLSALESETAIRGLTGDDITVINETILSQSKTLIDMAISGIEKRIPPVSPNPIVFLTSQAPSPHRNDPPAPASGISAAFAEFSQSLGTGGDFRASGKVFLGSEGKNVEVTSNTWRINKEGTATGLLGVTTETLTVTGNTKLGNIIGNITFPDTLTVSSLSATSTTATSTFSGGVSALALNVTSASASSTFSNGLNLSGGCFAINGTCVGGSSVTVNIGTANKLSYYSGTSAIDSANFLSINTSSSLLGIGTTTPSQRLSVAGDAFFDANQVSFASSSASSLTVSYQSLATTTIIGGRANAFSFATSTTAVPFLTFDTLNYRIGIGTTSPATSTLAVAGSLYVRDNADFGQPVRFSASNTAPFTTPSSVKVVYLNADLLDGQDSSAFGAGFGLYLSTNKMKALAFIPTYVGIIA